MPNQVVWGRSDINRRVLCALNDLLVCWWVFVFGWIVLSPLSSVAGVSCLPFYFWVGGARLPPLPKICCIRETTNSDVRWHSDYQAPFVLSAYPKACMGHCLLIIFISKENSNTVNNGPVHHNQKYVWYFTWKENKMQHHIQSTLSQGFGAVMYGNPQRVEWTL